MQRILALFEERETRDELGLGAIRDSIADHLFPGTSIIQTRLRYMLFVPWMYREIEAQQIPSERVAAVARQRELQLATTLIPSGDFGIFGRTARGTLKRLPSSVYWAGLGTWGIRRFPGSQDQYHGALDGIYRLRRAVEHRTGEEAGEAGVSDTWHPKLPEAPDGFPHDTDFRLTAEEGDFVRERIVTTHPRSLLAYLVLHARPADAPFPWMHPDLAAFPEESRELLEHARLFSQAMEGTAILYNLMLAEVAAQSGLVDEHRHGMARWSAALDRDGIRAWPLDRFWMLVSGTSHTVTHRARTFVGSWVEAIRGHDEDSPHTRALVRARETLLKGGRSRFSNRRALEQWRGRAGLRPMSYRWPTVSTFLSDLAVAGSD